jgi:predicted RNA binding protein YcfA (HicA-like mRNA interferase family)
LDKRLLNLGSHDVIKILQLKGFTWSRTKGSHHQYVGYIKERKRRVTVIASQKRFTPKTLKSMIEQSALSEEE